MKVIPITSFDPDTVDGLLTGVPFFRDLKQNDESQYKLLLTYSNFYEAEPNEKVITKGQRDKMYYFLLRGQLLVYPDGTGKSQKGVNYIGSGQVFGALAMLCDIERTASIVVDPQFSKAMLFGADFKPFGELEDFRQIRLETKLAFYRGVVHHTRWKLEVYKMDFPDNPLVNEMKRIEFFLGEKGTVEELRSLDRQTHQITALLKTWNKTFESKAMQKKEPPVATTEAEPEEAKEEDLDLDIPTVSNVLHTA